MGPITLFSDKLHDIKYRLEGETFEDFSDRLSSAICDGPEHNYHLNDIIRNQKFLPAGRVQSAMGSPHKVTAFNCLAGETEILTKEYGSVPIKDVSGMEVTLLDGNGDWVKCPVLCHGMQTTYALDFVGRYTKRSIRSTLDHGWVSPDQGIAIKTRKANHHGAKKTIGYLAPKRAGNNSDEYRNGVIHGLIYGDGTREHSGSFSIRICSNHNDTEPWFSDYSKTYPPSSNGDPHYRIKVSEAWCNLKQTPNTTAITMSYLTGFIRGWFMADGCVDTQGSSSICGDPEEYEWLNRFAPLVGMQIGGFSKLAEVTNFGRRNKESCNIFLLKASLVSEDFLLSHHRARWDNSPHRFSKDWRMTGKTYSPRDEIVYCPVVPTTHSFALSCGIHSSNCFVGGEIPDSMRGIMKELADSSETLRKGGGCGWDFSTIRPSGLNISTSNTPCSGPVSFMGMWDAMCKTVMSQGLRRGAMMGVLRVDHPDILKFIKAKKNENELNNFNMSVAITDDFMKALANKESYDLVFEGNKYGVLDASFVWDQIMQNNWDWAEPGVIFIDTINKMNPLYYCEEIHACNPCGEQNLPHNGACLLASFNLTKYIDKGMGKSFFDYSEFISDIPAAIRGIDNVIDRTDYPLEAQKAEAISKRRMGFGVTGTANALELLGFSYGSDEYIEEQGKILSTLRDTAYMASADLAVEKGSFPLYDQDKWMASGFAKTLPENIRDYIKARGLRNGLLLSIAPTGTISLCADNISSGIEPPYMTSGLRKINLPEGAVQMEVKDWAFMFHSIKCKTAEEVEAMEHVKVLCEAQKYIDNAVSKTCNVGDQVTYEEFKNIYLTAYEMGAKGCTTFRIAGKRFGIMQPDKPEEQNDDGAACFFDPETGTKSCS